MNKMGFRNKMFVYYSLIVFCVIIIGFGAVYLYIVGRLETEIVRNMDLSAKEMTGQLDNTIREMDRIAVEVVANPTIQEYMQNQQKEKVVERYSDMQNMAYDTLISLSARNLGSMRVSIYNQYGSYTSIGIPTDQRVLDAWLTRDDYRDWFAGLIPERNSSNILLPHDDFWTNGKTDMISVVREIIDIDSYASFGIVEVQYPLEKLKRLFSETKEQYQYLLSADGTEIYRNEDEKDIVPELLQNFSEKEQDTIQCKIGEENYYISWRKSKETGWYFAVVRAKKVLWEMTSPIIGVVFLIAALILGLTLIFIAAIANHLTKPLNNLQKKIHVLTAQNASEQQRQGESDEIKMLDTAFDSLYRNLQVSRDELDYVKLQEIKTQMLAVQAQTNPHFLYNTLSVISAIALDYQAEEIMDMCKALSSMLRYSGSFSYDKVSLEQEIRHAENYLDLMYYRFKDQVSYHFRIPESIKEIKVPKLILQPIVENCFSHGFASSKPPWKIYIEAGRMEKKWYLKVMDNGGGFSQQALQQLKMQMEHWQENLSDDIGSLGIGGYGLNNVIIRLKIAYGMNYIFRVYETQLEQETYCTVEIGGDIDV